jgi:alpha-L-rhamnosidase
MNQRFTPPFPRFSMLQPLAPNTFAHALPVWPLGRETLINDFVGFRAIIDHIDSTPAILTLAASTLYRITVNGLFAGHGPARAPHGQYRVDSWNLTPLLKPIGQGPNVIAIEVAGYNANSYYLLDQPSFLQAELTHAGKTWATGAERGFEALDLPYKRRKVPRFSYQRPSMEAYILNLACQAWKTDPNAPVKSTPVARSAAKPLLPRRMPYPTFATRLAGRHVSTGLVTPHTPEKIKKDRSLTNISNLLKGYPESQLEISPTTDLQHYATKLQPVDRQLGPADLLPIDPSTAQILDLGTNLSGFVGLTLHCQKPGRFALLWEELLDEGDVKVLRVDCANMVVLDLQEPVTYHIETLEPYTLRYLKLMATSGEATASDVYLREYAHPDMEKTHFACSDPQLNRVYRAAVQTLRQNAADLLTDCPGRERAGWLCDSYFSARVSMDLTGSPSTEAKFLEDYLLAPHIPPMPEGMMPMCYPADHPNGNFIPQWPMWLVLQIEEYLKRSGDSAMVDAFKPKVEAFIKYFDPFVNSDGLLEKLNGWRFIEWSKANDLTLDVNYPTNMLFAGMLDAAARLYARADWAARATKMRETIIAQSFDGDWFVDNALRQGDGKLKPSGERTEVCQYYAFYFDVASPERHAKLWRRLRDEFGPQRASTGAHKDIHPANAFIGNYLRIELLSRQNLQPQIEKEIAGYFLKMADLTGTLWENDGTYASCNHGFASHVARWLFRDLVGLYEIDTQTRTVKVKFTPNTLAWADLRQAVGADYIGLAWTKGTDGAYEYRLDLPQGYTAQVDTLGVKARRI